MGALPTRSTRTASREVLAWMLVLLVLAAGSRAAGRSDTRPQQGLPAADGSAAAGEAFAPRRDLRADERLGRHTLSRHVAKTDAELATRLRMEPQIAAASTYIDIDTAERVVGAALLRSQRRVEAWLRRTGARPNLTLTYTQFTGPPLGRSLVRGARTAVACHQALVVLRWDDRARRWLVLTSYPEARP